MMHGCGILYYYGCRNDVLNRCRRDAGAFLRKIAEKPGDCDEGEG